MKKIIKYIIDFVFGDSKVVVKGIKNSNIKITVDNKVVFDNTKNNSL